VRWGSPGRVVGRSSWLAMRSFFEQSVLAGLDVCNCATVQLRERSGPGLVGEPRTDDTLPWRDVPK
jgi:hypothetical protein